MFLSILSLLGGGLLRLAPELFAFLNKKADNDHELAMMDKQFQLEEMRGRNQLATTEMQTTSAEMVAMLGAQADALKSQMQLTGTKWVDALNFLVRPLTTYYVLLMYGAAKVAMFVVATQNGLSGWEAVLQIYNDEDRNILSGILGFWFIGRAFEKRKS